MMRPLAAMNREAYPHRHSFNPLFLLALAGALVGAGLAARAKASRQQDKLFAVDKVLQLNILISSNGIESLQQVPKKPVLAAVAHEGRVYTNVALHLKGLGSFLPITDKPSFSIKFNP